jgi:hypothetical protein
MKAYLFDTEHGLYQGETFEDADMLVTDDGITPIPPPTYGHGEIPVFDRQRGVWVIIPVTVARQLLTTRNATTTETQR